MQLPDSPLSTSRLVSRIPFYYGWIILAVSALAIFISGPGQTYSASIFVDPIIADLGWSRTLVSGLYTGGSLTAGFLMIFVGRLLDRFGGRVMLAIVCVLFGLAALWMSGVDHPIKLFAGYAFLRTLGQGSLTLIPTTLISVWFVKNRGKATAIGTLGGAISGAVFPIMIHSLISDMGWRDSWQVLSYIIWGALLIPVIIFIRRSPESVGITPSGKSLGAESVASEEENDPDEEVHWSLGEAIRTKSFWFLITSGLGQPLIGTALIFHQISLLTEKGVSGATAASVFGIMAPMQILGSFLAGFLSDRYSNRILLMAGQGFLILAMLWTFTISSTWQAFVYGGLMGLSAGFIMTVNTVIWPNYYGRKHLGSIRGVVTASMVGFAALGPLPFGWIFDLTGNYSLAILCFLILPVICGVAAFLARRPQKAETGLSTY